MTDGIDIRAVPQPTDDGTARLEAWLNEHAEGQGQSFRNDSVLLEANDGETVLGGALAVYGVAWCFVKYLAVAPEARGRGIGRRLMETLEDEARARGQIGIWLDTFSFQAPAFYEALGYERIGMIDDYPPGEARYFYAKRLDGRAVNRR